MQRIILHWTAGANVASAHDREPYHVLIERGGRVVMGKLKPESNRNIYDGIYAAHTRGTNAGAVGVAVCGMAGARERPFLAGTHPITEIQVDAMVREVASLCATYRIPVTRSTVLTHAEVQPTLGIVQAGKWDITWLPGMAGPEDPIKVGDMLRAKVVAAALPVVTPTPAIAPTPVVDPPGDDPEELLAAAARLISRARAALAKDV